MKNYKVNLSGYKGKVREALSAAVQEKAFELGYEWAHGKEVFWLKSHYLFLEEDCKIRRIIDEDVRYFEGHSGEEISAAEFLSLTQDEPELKPFDKVLVRDFDSKEWRIDFFEAIHKDKAHRYWCLKSCWHQCILYEGNEHLIGSTDEPRG